MCELTVVIVNHNASDHLMDCLRSLTAGGLKAGIEIIVVDNQSTDGGPHMLKAGFPCVKLICNMENIGFGKANNQGIQAASGEFVLLLNADTLVTFDSLYLLINEIKSDPGIGAIGPAMVDDEGRYQVSFGNKVSFFSEFLQKLVKNAYWKRRLKTYKKKRSVTWISGACMLSRKEILENAGLFDGNFFLYFEDIDLCYRIRQKGKKIVFFPFAKIQHKGGVSTEKIGAESSFHYRKSQLYFYRKHNSPVSLFFLHIYLRVLFWIKVLKIDSSEFRHLMRKG